MGLGHYNWYQNQTPSDVPTRTLGSEGGWIGGLISVGEKNEAFFIRVWKPLSNRHILKISRVGPEGKVQRGQHQLARGLSRYIDFPRKKCIDLVSLS